MVKSVLTFFAWVALFAALIYAGFFSGCAQQQENEREAQERADETPHVIREADGCKVYAFKSGSDFHYFTRCGSTVTTERNWTERQGKQSVHKSETIVTEGNS
jgi:hypothetical protein